VKRLGIRGILFDKDGTLVDFGATWFAVGEMMALRAADGDEARARQLLVDAGYDAGAGRFKADSVFASGTNADIVALWYPHADKEKRDAVVAEFDTEAAEAAAARAVAVPGCREAVASLRRSGYRLGVATNDSTSGAEKMLLTLGIAQMFEATYGYDAVANPKPAPDSIIAFADLTGLKPSEIAMVGDNRHDLEMARAAGAGLAVAVLSGTGTRESLARLADVVLGSIAELPDYLSAR
jgi:phosphoglycolate phosphatase